MLQFNEVSVNAYGRQLLEGIDLELPSGQILAVLGPNGAGKTSLLKTASGELNPSHGECVFLGRAVHTLPIDTLARHMAVLPQFAPLNFPFTVEEVVCLGRTPHKTGRQRDREISKECLGLLKAEHLSHRLYTELSGGERQRVQLARVLSQVWSDNENQRREPRCLLLDEPTAALDLSLRSLVLNVLRQFTDQGLAIMLVLHDFNLAAQYADNLILLKDGEVAACGNADAVLTTNNIRAVFDADVHILQHPDTSKPVVVQTLNS